MAGNITKNICHAGAEATAAQQEAEAADTARNPQQGRAEEFRSLCQEQRAAIDAAAAQRTAAADEVIGLATRFHLGSRALEKGLRAATDAASVQRSAAADETSRVFPRLSTVRPLATAEVQPVCRYWQAPGLQRQPGILPESTFSLSPLLAHIVSAARASSGVARRGNGGCSSGGDVQTSCTRCFHLRTQLLTGYSLLCEPTSLSVLG